MSGQMLGGFFYGNIRTWIIEECIKSGNPDAFLDNVDDIIMDLIDERDAAESEDVFWEAMEDEVT